MISALKKVFAAKCPNCRASLSSQNDALCSTKVCPVCQYKEETYCSLGVRIIYFK